MRLDRPSSACFPLAFLHSILPQAARGTLFSPYPDLSHMSSLLCTKPFLVSHLTQSKSQSLHQRPTGPVLSAPITSLVGRQTSSLSLSPFTLLHSPLTPLLLLKRHQAHAHLQALEFAISSPPKYPHGMLPHFLRVFSSKDFSDHSLPLSLLSLWFVLAPITTRHCIFICLFVYCLPPPTSMSVPWSTDFCLL